MNRADREVLVPLRVGVDAVLFVKAVPLPADHDGGEIGVAGRMPSTRQVVEVIRKFADELTVELSRTDAT